MNSRNWFGRTCHLGLSGLVILVGLIGGEGSNLTFAQVTADPSLGTEVKPNGTTLEIRGGTTVGNTNLFHSFSNFSVKSGEVVDFLNAATINNIFVRVTGVNPSDILGTLQAHGHANLFLINPNGITFSGRDAGLIIGGSFIGTTASAIQFPSGGEFSMTSQVNSLNPLLTVNPSAFLFNQIASKPISSIQVNKASLQVLDGQSLLLLGSDVNLEGGTLVAEGGRVELGGLVGVGTVGLNFDSNDNSNNLRLSFPQGVQRANVSLNASSVIAGGTGGGGIQVQGRRVTLSDDSDIAVDTFGSGPGGTLVVNASEWVELQGPEQPSYLKTETSESGSAGELRIETPKLIVKDGSQVSATTFSTGQGGRLSVTADSIQLMGTDADGNPSGLFAKTQPGTGSATSGEGGNINLQVRDLILMRGSSQISASASNNANGEVVLTADAPTATSQSSWQTPANCGTAESIK